MGRTMDLRDLIDVSLKNLWRAKLRTALTVAGVAIAIAMFFAMLSFAAGNHRYFTETFRELGLLSQISVTPRTDSAESAEAPILDNAAVERLSRIPGVRLAYPYSVFNVTAAVMDTVVRTTARSLSSEAVHTRLFSSILGGSHFSSPSAHEAIVTGELADLTASPPESLLGRRLVVSVEVARFDSALAAAVGSPESELERLLIEVDEDSIYDPGYRRRFARRELSDRIGRFVQGLMNRKATVSDTLTIVGVAPADLSYRVRTSPIVISDGTAERLGSGGVIVGPNPSDLLIAAREGALFNSAAASEGRSYPRVTLELNPLASHDAVADSVEALGYRAYSFASQFKQMQRFMVYYYLGLGAIGLIALVTASLGIINTMVMSVSERRREIGILKSLGGHEGDIRRLYLAESAVIGAIGSIAGISAGWAGAKAFSLVIRAFMERQEMPVFDPFAFPAWLVVLAFSLGLVVSLAAGLYPAARAAAVEPVEALRSE
jgi:ABC-type antimicrobial peptide transport system permease subunit